MIETYPRDLVGYGATAPNPQWPGDARVAVSFVLNIEEGAENSVLHGDATSEVEISDSLGAQPVGDRQMTVESMFEYGSRSGVWRLARLFEAYEVPITVFVAGMAAERHPEVVRQLACAGHEICGHGYRWINYQDVDPHIEREHIRRTVAALADVVGQRPVGWYTGRTSPRTRALVVEEGGFIYDSDAYNDDLPYWSSVDGKQHLVVPYMLDTNDMRFATSPGFGSTSAFFEYLRDTFDELYCEGAHAPKMMSVGLHARLAGRPGRVTAVRRFLDHITCHDRVWVPRRVDIAQHWIAHYPPD